MSIKSISVGGRTDIKKVTIGGGTLWEEQSAPPVDKYSWEAVIASVNAGTYRNDYSIGDLIPLDLGTEGLINMQIAAFDKDTLADGTGTAAISFVSKELLETNHRINPARTPSAAPYNEGTGAIGGWEKCEMRLYLKGTIKPLISSEVRSAIVEVGKTHTAYDSAGTSFKQTTQDDVWLPSWDEISGSSAKYVTLFPNNASRVKYKVGEESASTWWTRQASASDKFNYVHTLGTTKDAAVSVSRAVALGFCIGRTTS